MSEAITKAISVLCDCRDALRECDRDGDYKLIGLIDDTCAELSKPAPLDGEVTDGELNPRRAYEFGQLITKYSDSFNDQDWGGINESVDRKNLALALDHLTQAGAMLMNVSERLEQTNRAILALRPQAKPIEYVHGEWYKARDRDDLEAFFASLLPAIREAAREHGYAIGLHGSLRRDMDLIATPWREGESDKDTLAHAIAVAACGITRDGNYQWTEKPLGRFATSIPCCWSSWYNEVGTGHIDLSVTPSLRPQAESKTYADGTTATGVAPLPDVSPAEQDAIQAEGLLNDLEAMLGGRSGASIKLRSLIRPLRPQAVQMTEWEIADIFERWDNTSGASMSDFVRMVEAHHGITAKAEGAKP